MASDLSLAVVLGATMSNGFKGVFGGASKSVGELGATVKATHAQLKDVSAYQRTEAALGETRAKLTETTASARGLKQAMAAGDASPKLAKQLKTTEGNAEKLTRTLETQKAKLRQQGDALRKSGVDTQHLGDVSKKLTATFEKQKSALASNYAVMEKRRKLMGELRSQAVKLVAVGAFIKAGVSSANRFEDAMAGVRQVVRFDTPQQFKQMQGDLTQLSMRLPIARDELAGLVADGAKLALPRAELLQFAQDSTKVGMAFGLSAHDAGQAIGQWRAAFHLTEEQAISLADQIAVLGKTTGADAATLTQFIGEIGASGEAMGFTGGQIAALTGTMVGLGAKTTDATQGTRMLISTLAAGAAATDKQKQALAAVGIDAVKFAKRMETDAAGGVVALMDRLKGLSQSDQAKVLQNLFGRRGVATILPLIKNVDLLRTSLHKASDETAYAGAMEAQFQEKNNTTSAGLKRAHDAWDNLTGIIGEQAAPAIGWVADKFTSLVGVIKTASDNYPRLTAGVLAGAGAFLTFNTALTGIKLVGTFLPGLKTVGGAARMLFPAFGIASKGVMLLGGAIRGMGLALMANPIFIAIGLLATAGYLIYRNWGPIKDFFIDLWRSVSDWAARAWDAIKRGGEAVANALGAAWNFYAGVYRGIWEGIKAGAGAAWAFIGEVGSAVATAVSGAWNGAIGFIGGLWDALKAKVAAVVDWVAGKVEWIANKWQTIKGLPGAAWDSIKHAGAAVSNFAATPILAAAGVSGGGASVPMKLPPARGAGGGNVTYSTNAPITVNAAPGMDERALAKQVRRELDERDRAQAARRRSSLGDLD